MRKIQVLNADIYAGKGNFSELLSIEFDLRVISIGELIRTEFKSGGEVGLKMKEYFENGILLPPEFVNLILEKEILIDNKDILIVNYPTTEECFYGFKSLLKKLDIQLDKIWHLKLININYVSVQELIKLGAIYTEKYEITNDSLQEKIKENQEHLNKIIGLWKHDYRIKTIEIDYENINDIRNYLKGKIKST